MSNLHERIGEALLSNGQHDIIRAESKNEEDMLIKAGFTKVGSMKEGDKLIALFKIEQKTVEKIVQVPIITPSKPYGPIDTTPWDQPGWPTTYPWTSNEPYRMTYGTGTPNLDFSKTISSATASAYTIPQNLIQTYNMEVRAEQDVSKIINELKNELSKSTRLKSANRKV